MKGARPDPDHAIPTVPRVTVNVDEETLAAHDGMLGARTPRPSGNLLHTLAPGFLRNLT